MQQLIMVHIRQRVTLITIITITIMGCIRMSILHTQVTMTITITIAQWWVMVNTTHHHIVHNILWCKSKTIILAV